MTLDEYKWALSRHDWFYYFSDDHRVWQHGESAGKTLLGIAQSNNDDFKRAYNEEVEKHFNTESFYPKGGDRKWEPTFKL